MCTAHESYYCIITVGFGMCPAVLPVSNISTIPNRPATLVLLLLNYVGTKLLIIIFYLSLLLIYVLYIIPEILIYIVE